MLENHAAECKALAKTTKSCCEDPVACLFDDINIPIPTSAVAATVGGGIGALTSIGGEILLE